MQATILEQYDLRQAGRDEAIAAAVAALEEHLVRLNDRAAFSDFDHPYHAGHRAGIEFAITLVKLSI